MNKLLSIVQQVKLCLEVVWERPGRGINVKDNKSYHKVMKLYDGRGDI